MSRFDVVRLIELGTPRYWRRRQLYRQRRARVAAWFAKGRERAQSTREGLGAWQQLLVGSLGLIVAALVGLAVLEVVAAAARMTEWGASLPLFVSPEPELQEPVSTLVGAAVAIAATLLGLYYTTVGVIASTIYRSVPGDVRDLFITERSSEVYLKVVVLTIAGGIVILVAGAFGYDTVGLSLLALGLFTALTCIGLVGVTRRLFDYFDPSKLSAPLLAQIEIGIGIATNARARTDARRQYEAHYKVYRALASFRHLVEMLDSAELRNANAPVALTRQLLGVVSYYSAQKYRIPTNSRWWDRVPKHRDWLTIDQSRLHLALNTRTSFPPEEEPDYLWLENTVARMLQQALAVAFRSQAGADALSVSQAVANLVATLSSRLQIDEALAIETAWDNVIREVAVTPDVAAPHAADYQIRLNQMAGAESLVLPLTQMLLGLEFASRRIIDRDLQAEFEAALADPSALYGGALPTTTRQMLEGFSTAIERERDAEGHRVTPAWWVSHLAARSMADALLATESGILQAVRSRTTEQIAAFRAAERPDLAAVTGMAALELLHKLEFHLPTVRRAEEKLRSYRNANTSIPQWPDRPEAPIDPADEHVTLLGTLSALLPELYTDKFDPREPDLFGQLYQFVVDGAFRSILDGDEARGLTMYSAVLGQMQNARARIDANLGHLDLRTRATYALEPVITAMDLAGYALMMYELDSSGIWPSVKEMWSRVLDARPELAEFLVAAASVADTSMMSTGGLERGRRSTELQRLFEERDIRHAQPLRWGGDGEVDHPSPIVRALSPNRVGFMDDLYVLFVAEYLKDHLSEGVELGTKATRLMRHIDRQRKADERTQSAPNAPDPEGDGDE